MKNANIAKVLKEYRKRNQLSVTDVSIQLSQKSVPVAPKPFMAGKAVRPSPMPIFLYISANFTA